MEVKNDHIIPDEVKRRLDSLFNAFSIVAEGTQVFLCNMEYDYSRWSRELVETFGLPSEYMYDAGQIWEERIHPDDRTKYHEMLEGIFSGKLTDHDVQYRARRRDGDYDVCTCRGLVIPDEKGKAFYFGGAIRNHSKKNYIDPITGLRSQYGFFEDLQSYIRNRIPIRIGMCGIGKLAEINEVYGYHSGNKILQNLGRFLMDNVADRIGTYRMDGSRFAVISTRHDDKEFADLYEVVREHYRKGIKLDGQDFMLELNAGMISLNDFNVDDQTVYSCLNLAYEESKLNKHGDLVTFRNRLTDESRKRIEMLHVIRASIAKDFNGFFLVYQPVVDAATQKLIGAEALLRWKNDEYGVVPPDLYISFLEKDPLFPKLGEWILETALRDAGKIMKYIPGFTVNVNLSYVQLEKPDFINDVYNAVRTSGYPARQLCLEITECCRLLDMELLNNVVVALRGGGVRIALDDFGTGYSSVGLVKNLPFDIIKIDKGFVQKIEQDERERKLLCSFTGLAGIFGANVCVEGIETSGMRDIIANYEVHSFQGYYYSKPISIEELLDKAKCGPDCFAK